MLPLVHGPSDPSNLARLPVALHYATALAFPSALCDQISRLGEDQMRTQPQKGVRTFRTERAMVRVCSGTVLLFGDNSNIVLFLESRAGVPRPGNPVPC